MQNEKMQINLDKDCQKAEVIIREVDKVNELPVLEPEKVNVSGTITSIFSFLEKRWGCEGQINHEHTHIIVDRDNLSMTLIANETDARNKMVIVGKLQLSRQFMEFHINDGYAWEPLVLSQFIKMNRAYFSNRDENMKLVSVFKNFKAKVNTDYERDRKENGSYTDNYSQIVDSNMPDRFSVVMPIFKGTKAQSIEVETYATINGHDVTVQLISPSAQQVVDETLDAIIDEQIAAIREIAPEIPFIEK
jgi:hypothetical protein